VKRILLGLVALSGLAPERARAEEPAPAAPEAAEAPPAEGPSKEVCIDANEAAQRLIRAGSFADARPQIDVCLANACPEPVRKDCADLSKAMEQTMPKVSFDARDAKGAPVTDVKVTMDGRVIAERLDGTPLALDPGRHAFVFEAPGLPRITKTIALEPGAQRTERVDMVDMTGPILRTTGLALGAVGGLMIGYGGFLGIRAKIRYDRARDHCPDGPRSCEPAGVQGGRDAHDDASTATTMMAVGALVAAGGGALYLFVTEAGFRVTPGVRSGGMTLEASTRW
jgi:hypothetical protein